MAEEISPPIEYDRPQVYKVNRASGDCWRERRKIANARGLQRSLIYLRQGLSL